MIASFRSKALKAYWNRRDLRGINPNWLMRINRVLSLLDEAKRPEDMDIPGFYFHKLSGRDSGRYSVRITGNWRITFAFEAEHVIDVNLEDYH